jgi:predicted ATP-grasp superfamily ATP-dependent carboligase
MPLTVFVTDGDQRPALAIVRSLARRGIAVVVGEHRPTSLAGSSKYCARNVRYPSPYHDRDGFDRFLRQLVDRERIDVVMPVTDVTTRAVCANHEHLAGRCAAAVPPLEAFDLVTNKARLLDYARRCGVPVPRTHLIDGARELGAVVDRFAYPVVVKPVQSRIQTAQGWLAGIAHYAYSRDDLERLYRDHEYLERHPSLLQERIVGPGVGMFALFDRGRMVAEFSHVRLREKPPAGGASVLSESVPVDPRLREFANRLLSPIGWHGVAMMEFKRDLRTGEPFLIEVNGRFWGSLELAIEAGVDFPGLAVQLACGTTPDAPASYDVGVRNRWLLGDLDHLLMRLRRGPRALHLPDGSPSTARTVVDFLRIVEPRLHYEVFSAADWRPFAHELWRYVCGFGAALATVRRAPSPGRLEPTLVEKDARPEPIGLKP